MNKKNVISVMLIAVVLLCAAAMPAMASTSGAEVWITCQQPELTVDMSNAYNNNAAQGLFWVMFSYTWLQWMF